MKPHSFAAALCALSLPTALLAAQSATPSPGFTYADSMFDSSAVLYDESEQLVQTWNFQARPGLVGKLDVDGNTLRTYVTGTGGLGGGGGLERIAFDGTLLWRYEPSLPAGDYLHHDIAELPNGNVLMTVIEVFSAAEMIALGKDPLSTFSNLLSERIIEVQQTGLTTGAVIWEWHATDHLVQDFDAGRPDFDVIADRPERIDVNFQTDIGSPLWLHCNSLDYNADLDQIALSTRTGSELWIIDHSTTTAEAAGSMGGQSGKGGDILYRWGNPAMYDTAGTRHLFGQHDVTWIEEGLPGAGNLICFNNQKGQLMGGILASSVTELVPPVDANGNYALTPGLPYGPAAPVWEYLAPNPTDMYSPIVSGAQRLPNGNTLITVGTQNRILEVGLNDQIVWEVSHPQTFKARRYLGELIGTPEVYCTAKTSTAGCVAQISTSSPMPPISGDNDYSVIVSGVQGQKNGLVAAGISGPGAIPFLGGTLCIQPPLQRGGLQNSGGATGTSCDGSMSSIINDGNAIPGGLDGLTGNTVWYQWWYRDPSDVNGAALSDAVAVEFK